MRGVLLVSGISGAVGCGLGPCVDLCRQNADCLAAEVAVFDTTWEAWTGFADRGAYEAECLAVFEESASRGRDLRRTCRREPDSCGRTP